MSTAFQALRSAMATNPTTGKERRWEELMAELWPVISSPLMWEGERLLLDILHFDGRLRLAVSSELPHSMPPEDMLKSLAIQALGRWTALAHLHEMKRVQMTTSSSSLSSLAQDVIQQARETLGARRRHAILEEIGESSSEDASKIVSRPLAEERGMSFVRGRSAPHRELARVG